MQNSIIINIFLAFLGGIIMNFMPCILPLISLKISSFLNCHNNKKIYFFKNMYYIAGIISFFITMGIILAFLKFSGQNIIFGTHMQSGWFLFIIFAILTLIGFNLSGLFEINLNKLENHSAGLLSKFSGFAMNYFNGLLSSVLAIPCTAPFIATAFTFAVSTNYINLFLISFFMGLGFALPFILAIFFPKYIFKIMPKPGLWMEKFKQFMALPIYGSALWILFVLIKQQNLNFVALSLFFGLLSYFFIWFYKNFQISLVKKISIYLIVIAISYAIFPWQKQNYSQQVEQIQDINTYGEKQSFSMQKLNNAMKNKQKIFIAASASWCLSCHVNEKNALSSEKFFQHLKDNKIIYLYIDLTSANKEGQEFLAQHKQIGIPFYLFIDKNNNQTKLPQLITEQIIFDMLN